MKILSCVITAALTVGIVGVAAQDGDIQANASAQILQWQKQSQQYIEATIKPRSTGCTSRQLSYRREWGSLSKRERREYIQAVQCIRQKPARSSNTTVPGARTRYDDWLATHIINTLQVHFSGLFFQYHRHATWTYEKALQEECGYRGTQPYWDWTTSYKDPWHHPALDGSSTSMGGNGQAVPHGNVSVTVFGFNATFPPGTGGGCIESGPFANTTVNLGPNNLLDYNPRCVIRDISTTFQNYTRPTSVVDLIQGCGDDFACFNEVLGTLYGMHVGGHFTIGGLQNDIFASPGDPMWYLHHSQIDRVWTIWQDLHPEARTYAVSGTGTANNSRLPTSPRHLVTLSRRRSYADVVVRLTVVPPSPNVTLDSMIDFQSIDDSRSLRYLASTIDGPYCYAYK
ncbi:MAG: hypothetical protein Q9222_002516 [Ikaeria aurantiellina]